jgi:hypothetical protein
MQTKQEYQMISPCGIRSPQLQNAAETAVTQKTEPGVQVAMCMLQWEGSRVYHLA